MKDNWNRIKLDELGKHYGGLTNKSKDNFGKGKPYIPYLNIFLNGKIDKDNLELVEIFPSESQNKVKKGDLFFTTSSETPHEVGMTSVLVDDIGEAYLNSFCFGFRLDDFETLLPEFAVYLFRGKEIRKTISDLAQGSTRYNLSKSIFFSKLLLNLPPLPQQQKIAKILSTVDNVIEKTESAIAKYQAIKQGLMHDVFTRGIDVNTGKLRPTPQDAPELYKESVLGLIPREWEVKKLEDFLYLKSGEGITSKNISDFGQYPVYGGNGLRGYTNSYTHEGEYVLIGRQGALCGNITFSDGKMYASEHAVVVTIIDDSNVKWIEYKLRLMNLNQYSEASAQPGLSVNKINRLLIKVPNAIEQNLIASRFIGLENKIQTEQQALAKYQQLKAGLLQDLLTGKVEVGVD